MSALDIFYNTRPWSDFPYDVFVGDTWHVSARTVGAGDLAALEFVPAVIADAPADVEPCRACDALGHHVQACPAIRARLFADESVMVVVE